MRSSQRILLVFFLAETLCVTYALYIPFLTAAAAVLYAVSGVAIAYQLLFLKPASAEPAIPSLFQKNKLNRYRWLMLGAALLVMVRFTIQWITDEPLEYHTADMLPIIKVMCGRFLSGEWRHVYDPIPEIWSGTVPIYLPAMWLPFILPEALQADPRWLTCGLFFILLVVFARRFIFAPKNNWVVLLCVFLLSWWIFYDEKSGVLPYSEEVVVIFFYSILTLALMRKNQNAWLLGLCTALCALSRYALAGWLPAMVLFFVYQKEWKPLLQFAATGVACFAALVLLPFGWNRVHSIFGLPNAYIDFAGRVWKDSPEVFYGGVGWARFFGKDRIVQQHYLLMILTFAVPLGAMLVGLLMQKKYHFPAANLPLAVFKLSLVVFFCMIDVPYLYLFYTSSFVSLFAVAAFVRRGQDLAG